MADTCDVTHCWDPKHWEDRCPNCDTKLGERICHMMYATWRCWGCGATLDSRVVMPKTVHVGVQQFDGPGPISGEERSDG